MPAASCLLSRGVLCPIASSAERHIRRNLHGTNAPCSGTFHKLLKFCQPPEIKNVSFSSRSISGQPCGGALRWLGRPVLSER